MEFATPADVRFGAIVANPFVVSDASGKPLATMGPSSYAACVGNDLTDSTTGLNDDGLGNGVIRRGPANPCPTTGAAFYLSASLVPSHCNVLNTNSDPDGGIDDFSSRRPGGANVAFADGSVRFLKTVSGNLGTRPDGSTIYSPSSLVLQAMGTRSGGEIVSSDAY